MAACTCLLLGGEHEDRVHEARLGGGAVSGDSGLQLRLGQLHALLGGELLLEDEVDQLSGHDVVGAGAEGVGQREAGAGEVGIDVPGGQGGGGLRLERVGPEVLQLLAVRDLAAADVGAVDGGQRLEVALPEAVDRARRG